MGSAPRKQTKTYKTPKRPYEATRLDAELKVRCYGDLELRVVADDSSLGSMG